MADEEEIFMDVSGGIRSADVDVSADPGDGGAAADAGRRYL